MRILYLAHRLPFPPNKGDKIRSYNEVQYLAQKHEVHVATLVDDAADLKHVDAFRGRVKSLLIEPIHSPLRKVFAARSLLGSRPVTLSYFYSPRLQQEIDALIDRVAFDCCICFSSPMAEYVFRSRHAQGRLRDVPKFMDFIDIDSLKWAQYARRSPLWKSWIYRHEATTLARYEQLIAERFDRLFVVSEQERALFPGGAPASLHAMSNGVDLDFFSPVHGKRDALGKRALVFTGVMDYWPNIEGVQWFVDQVLPRVQASVAGATFHIVGSRPTPEVRRLGERPGVFVTGFVDDVRDYLASASVCVVPLRIARGIQNKVLEAMAMGRAVVSTPDAFEGVRAEAGRDIAVAPDEAQFAESIVDLLNDGPAAEQLGANARACVERHYSWNANLQLLDRLDQ